MNRTQTILLSYILISKPLAYGVIFLGMMIEGDIFLFTTAFLTSAGFFDVWDVAAIAISGALIGDVVWFWLGQRFMHSSKLLSRLSNRFAAPFDAHLKDYPLRTIFLSKFTYGIHRLLLARTGAHGMAVSRFIKLDALAIIAWALIIGGLGYFSGASIHFIRHYLKFTEVALGLGLIAFFVFQYIADYVTRRNL